jgi:hypothetical protein
MVEKKEHFNNIIERLSDKIIKNGFISIEESNFFDKIISDVLFEAVDEFIPDQAEIPQDSVNDSIILFDEVGNGYVYQNSQIIPQDGSPEEIPDILYDEQGNGYTFQNGQLIPTDVGDQQQGSDPDLVNESTSLLQESDAIVSKILANLK